MQELKMAKLELEHEVDAQKKRLRLHVEAQVRLGTYKCNICGHLPYVLHLGCVISTCTVYLLSFYLVGFC